MKKFTFKDLVNFFGNRGIILRRKYIKKWGNDDTFVYWIPNKDYENNFFATTLYTTEDSVMWCIWKTLIPEVEDEVLLENSPYKWR